MEAKVKQPWHGTPGGYRNHMCRCDACREANTVYMAVYRERERAKRQAEQEEAA